MQIVIIVSSDKSMNQSVIPEPPTRRITNLKIDQLYLVLSPCI